MNSKFAAIILVVLVAGIVSGIGVYQLLSGSPSVGIPEESLQIMDSGVWLSSELPYCQATVLIINEKNVPSTLQKIMIRGVECSWSAIYYWQGEIGSVSHFSPPSEDLTGSQIVITVDGKELPFQQATGMIELDAYKAIALYIKNAGNITYQDIPKGNMTIAVFTERKAYLEEASLDVGSISFVATEKLKITKMEFVEEGSPAAPVSIDLSVSNIGTSPITISADAYVNGARVPLAAEVTLQANTDGTISIPYTLWVQGDNYQVRLTSTKGNTFTYTAVAPG